MEGLKFSRTTSKRYPWIQEFRSHYDFLIVGGGIVGSCIANFLAERIKVSRTSTGITGLYPDF